MRSSHSGAAARGQADARNLTVFVLSVLPVTLNASPARHRPRSGPPRVNVFPEMVTSTSPCETNSTTSRAPKVTTGEWPAAGSSSKWNCDWWIDPNSGPMTAQYRSAPRSALGARSTEKT